MWQHFNQSNVQRRHPPLRSLRVVSFSKETSRISYMATTRAWRGWDYSMEIGTLYVDCINLNESNYMFSSINCARCNQSSIFGFGWSNMGDSVTNIIIKLPHYGVTLCFQFFSAAVSVSVSAAMKWLLPLMSKLFALHLRYVGQRKYRFGEMHWMTFPWPWPKITAVALMKKNVLVSAI